MAITISQQPTTPNMANNNLLFTLSSNSSSAAQYQFVCDLTLSGSNTILQRIKQQPNPSGFGVFDLGQIVTNYLTSDNIWTAAKFATASEASKRFSVKFGEEYASSISGSPILYTGIAAVTGSPSTTGSAYYYFTNGLVDPYDKINWNFPSQSYFSPTTTPDAGAEYNLQLALTNAPTTQSIQDGEYATIALYNGNFNGSTTVAQDIFATLFSFYNSSGALILTASFDNIVANGGGPRTAGTQLWSNVVANATGRNQLIYAGVGYQNLINASVTIPTTASYYTVKFCPQAAASTINTTASFATYTFNIVDPRCGYNGVRFAWKNEFGVWDYYTFTLEDGAGTNIERSSYEQTFVDFSTPTDTVAYNKQRRGMVDFYNKLVEVKTANSDWLTQTEADWLKELFYSADVFIQNGSTFEPIVISSANLVQKKNPRTQKLFQYLIEFKPANQLTPRL